MYTTLACLGLYLSAPSASGDELSEIRQQMDTLQRTYETQIKALEERLQKAESLAEDNRAGLHNIAASPAPDTTGNQARDNAFNPALSLILRGSVNSYTSNPDNYALPGFQLGDEAGLSGEGVSLDETELTVSAHVDPLFYAQSTLALHDDAHGTEVSVEEAYIDPTALPAGFGARFGRFYSAIGYLNPLHAHAWDFNDSPLAYRAFLGNQYGDDGIRVTWTAPTDLYLMFGAETLAGKRFPAGEARSVAGDVQTLFAKTGGDLGLSWAWQAGVSALLAKANDRADGDTTAFSGDSDLYGVDFVAKWAPDGNPQIHNLTIQGEYFYRDESGRLTVTDAGHEGLLRYNGDQAGWYAQAVYQFAPRWRFGARYDRLTADNNLAVIDLGGYASAATLVGGSGLDDGHDPHRWSAMLDWTPSEFSRLRVQYNRDNSRPDSTDQQWSLQYIMSLGAHGAHAF
jgi:outer membrane receptor protein involved in Fe transport